MHCKNCGQHLNDNQAICLSCGVQVGNGNAYCANCGALLNPGAPYCMSCGVAVNNGYNPNMNNGYNPNMNNGYNPNMNNGYNPNMNNGYNPNMNNGYNPNAVPQQNPAEPVKGNLNGHDKTSMALLCFFLGGWGIHNFVMGETKRGIGKILATFLCGIGGILALIDFIKILRGTYVVDMNKMF